MSSPLKPRYCRNPRCREFMGDTRWGPPLFCVSCRYTLRAGLLIGGALAGLIAGLIKLL